MAFNMKPGKIPFLQTGHGLPSAFLQKKKPAEQEKNSQQNLISGNDLKEKALANAKEKQLLAGENKGDSKNTRIFEGTASATIPGNQVEKIASTPAEIAKWKAAKLKAEQEGKPFGEQYKPRTITEKATVSDTGMDKPELTTTPPKNPVSGNPSRTIYTIEGTRGYTNTDQTGSRGLTTLNANRVNAEVNFTNKMNEVTEAKYSQANEGDASARGLTGPQLEKRNKIVAERKQKLLRLTPTIKTTEADAKSAVNAASAMNRAHFQSNATENREEGIDKVVFQKRSENKKTSTKKSPAKQMKSKKKTPAKMKKY
jgi:hypothetical protein